MWNGKTVVELGKDGTRRTTFHRRGLKAWTHPYAEPYLVDYPRRLPCPECERSKR